MEKYIIGIDIGGTAIKAVLMNEQGRVLAEDQQPTPQGVGPVVDAVWELVLAVAREISLAEIGGVGVGIPGLVAPGSDMVTYAPNLGWMDVNIGELLGQKLGLPVLVENDANAAALGERWCGAGVGALNLALVTVGTGVGGGLILDGSIFHGAGGFAGELGHVTIIPDGPKCSCGNRGCLEELTAVRAFARMAREAINRGQGAGILAKAGTAEKITPKTVVDAARDGDVAAVEIVETIGGYLGLGLATLANIINPEVILLGGGISEAGDILLEPVRETVKDRALAGVADNLEIKQAKLGNRAGVIGAASLVASRLGII